MIKKIAFNNRSKLKKQTLSDSFGDYFNSSALIKEKLIKKYNGSQNYFYTSFVNNAIEKKSQCVWLVTLRDKLYDQSKEYMEKYYQRSEIYTEMPELIQYYRYYAQKPILLIKQFFQLLLIYYDKIKVVEYNKLKLILSLQTEQSSMTIRKNKEVPFPDNLMLLDEITLSICKPPQENEESYYVQKLRETLSNHYGHSKLLTLSEIDMNFDNINRKKRIKSKKKREGLEIGKLFKRKLHNTKSSNASCPDLQQIISRAQLTSMIKKKRKNNKSIESECKQNHVPIYSYSRATKTPLNTDSNKKKLSKKVIPNQERKIRTNICELKNKIKLEKQRQWRKIVNSTQSSYQIHKIHKKR